MTADEATPETASGSRVRAAAITHTGLVREHNEDAYAMVPAQDLYIVSDGMGGLAGGETASSIVVEALPKLLNERVGSHQLADADLREILRTTLLQLSRTVRRLAARRVGLAGMGATVVLALVHDDRVTVAHMGDSRAYRHRDGELVQLTEDHSVVGILLRRGEIRPGDVEDHPARGRITRYIGMEAQVDPDVRTLDFVPGDRLLLCSDGLAGVVRDEQIAALMAEPDAPAAACRRLVDAALAGGGPDNITVLIAERRSRPDPPGDG
ncbi:MAG TPA: protein phosphatase 2C domain-containing protein [Candidatus Limnocylindrales bacterium]